MPSRVMRADPHQMKPIDWSELALFGSNFHPPAATSPHWSLLAGLRQLGFGGNLLAETLRAFDLDAGILPRPNPDWTIRVAQEAPLTEPGSLVIIGNGDEPLERDDRAPYLVLREARAEEYRAGVEWLDRLGAFGILIDER
jgi:hypothetical protein